MFEPNMSKPASTPAHCPSVSHPLAAAGLFLALVLALAACDLGSSDSTTAVISDSDGVVYNYSGQYVNTNNNPLPPLVIPSGRQSGRQLVWLRLLQYGSVLEGFDNAGMNWEGQISGISTGGTAQFTLSGQTTAGANVEIVGSLHQNPGDLQASSLMDAAWIEPGFAGSIIARALVPKPVAPDPEPTPEPEE